MIKASEKKIMQWVLALGIAATSLYITPAYSNDPINVPKMFLLVLTGFFLFGFVINNLKSLLIINKPAAIALSLFIVDMVFVLFTSGAPLVQQIFGVNGRSTGIAAYLGLSSVLLAALLASDLKLSKIFSLTLLFSGFVSTAYGLLQAYGHDPIKWNNPYSSVISFLGNPDFASSFIALSSALAFGLILAKGTKSYLRMVLLVYLLVAFFTIIKSHAQQGVLVLLLVGSVTFIVFLYKSQRIKNVFAHLTALAISIVGFIGVLGIFKIGPLAESLYKISVRQRGFYWHAALEMLKSHPLTGIGMDSYGDWYLGKRSANAAFHSLPTQSNTAHNVYLDLASNGGLPMLIVILVLTGLTLWRAINHLRAMQNFDPFYVAIFTAWLGYQAQSIVSINQLGIAVWGWALSGILLGYPVVILYSQGKKPVQENSKPKRLAKSKIQWAAPVLSLLVGSLLAFPPYLADHQYRIAAASRDGNKVMASIKSYPESTGRTLQAASAFASSKLYPQALELAKHVTDVNPREYNAWMLISQITVPTSADHVNAIAKMQYLNPHDKTIK